MATVTILTTDANVSREGAGLMGESSVSVHPLVLTDPLHPALHEGATTWAFVDWLLPRMSGLELVRRLVGNTPPPQRIVMVMESEDLEDRRRALAAGADDYVTGPISARQMIDRVRNFQRAAGTDRMTPAPAHVIVRGDLLIDLEARLARYRGQPIRLQPRQFRLLQHLLTHPNAVRTREDLVAAVGQQDSAPAGRTVDKWVARLRTALNEVGAGNLLRTVHFEGYVLDLPDEQD